MDIERVVSEAVAGFTVGFGTGLLVDMKLNFGKEFIEFMRDDPKLEDRDPEDEFKEMHYNDRINKINKTINGIKYGCPVAIGYGTGLMHVYRGFGIPEFLTGLTVPSIANYLGIRAGEYVNQIRRSHATLNAKERKHLEQHVEEIKQSLMHEDEHDSEKNAERYANCAETIFKRKGNIAICKEFTQKIKEIVKYSKKYRKIKEFLDECEKEKGIGVYPFVLNQGETNILMLDKDEVLQYRAGIEDSQEMTHHEKGISVGFVSPFFKEGVKHFWDRTVEGLVEIVDKYTGSIIMVSINQDTSPELKKMAVFHAGMGKVMTDILKSVEKKDGK